MPDYDTRRKIQEKSMGEAQDCRGRACEWFKWHFRDRQPLDPAKYDKRPNDSDGRWEQAQDICKKA